MKPAFSESRNDDTPTCIEAAAVVQDIEVLEEYQSENRVI
jgi:hypothetical protein